jgi:hypothetical protein
MQDVFFVFEVKIDGAVGHAGFASDVGDFGVEIAVVSKDTDRRAKDRFALVSDYGPVGV